MRYFGVKDLVKQTHFGVRWHPGQENLADYSTKRFDAKHHREVRPWYLHEENSPRFLPRAAAPSTLRGCVGTLPNGYIKSNPLSRVNPKLKVNPRINISYSTKGHESHIQSTVGPTGNNSYTMYAGKKDETPSK